MSKRSATDCYPKKTKLSRSVNYDNHSQASGSSAYSESDDGTIPQMEPNSFSHMPNTYLASGVKSSLHGTIYQLKLLMVFIVCALKNNYRFRLATEIDAADKFDDLVFQYQSGNVVANRFLQAKHKQDESKLISFNDLRNERNDDFSLSKYFMSYLRIKRNAEFDGELVDFVLYTNIDLDYADLKRNQVLVDMIADRDDFIPRHDKALKCSFRLDSQHELYEKMRECSGIYTLAKTLVSNIEQSKDLTLRPETFKLYHVALVKENVIDRDQGKFHQKFITSDPSLSESASKLREIVDKLLNKTKGLTIANVSFKLSKTFGIGFELNCDPQIENVKEFVTHITNVIKNSANDTVTIQKQKGVIKDNIDKLAGHVIVENDDRKLIFSSKFLDISSTLCGNLPTFRTLLKNDLEVDNYDFASLNQLILNVPNFKTCKEEHIHCKATLPFDKIDDDEVDEFFKKLIFAVNQPNEIELSEIVEKEMRDRSDFNLLNGYLVANSFQIQTLDWFKEKCGTWISNENATKFLDLIKQKMAVWISMGYNSYIEELKTYEMSYRTENKSLREFLIADSPPNSNMSILNFISTENTLLGSIKVLQTVSGMPKYAKHDSYIFMRLTIILLPQIQRRVLTAFGSSTSNELLIIECNTKIDDKMNLDIYELSAKLLAVNSRKKLILISQWNGSENSIHPLVSGFPRRQNEYHDSSSFSNLCQESQRKVLEKMVLFQGEEVKLQEILPNDTFANLLDSDTLMKLIKNDEITIGSKLEILNDYNKLYYIKRSFWSSKPLRKISNQFNDPEQAREDSALQRPLPQSFFDAASGAKYARDTVLIENEFVDYQYNVASTKLILLSEDSGNGKSTVLYHLYELIKKSFPFHLIFSISLNNYTEIFKAELSSEMLHGDWAIDFLLKILQSANSYTRFEVDYIKASVKHPNKLTLFFDGFDEICPDYEELIIRLVSELRQTEVFKIWITTRSSMKDKLEKTFRLSAVSLQPFSLPNQIDFLTKFWFHSLDCEKMNLERLEAYANALIAKFLTSIKDSNNMKFTGSPLQLKMLASVFQQSSSEEWEGCREFLTSSHDKPIFLKKFQLNDIYEKFITTKCRIYSNEKGTEESGNLASQRANSFYMKCALKSLTELAFKELFDEVKIDCLPFQSDNDVLESIENIGIVQKINGNFQFVHKTFAEYLVAEYLASKLEKKPSVEFLFKEILIPKHNEGIRTFFDCFLSKTSIPEDSLRMCGQVLTCLSHITEYFTDSPLHLACFEGNVAIIYFIVQCLTTNGHTEEQTELLKCLIEAKNSNGETVLFKATELNNLNLITFLKAKAHANVEATDNCDRTVLMKCVMFGFPLEVIELLVGNENASDAENESVLFKAAEKGNLEVIQFLLRKGASVNFVSDNGVTVLHNAIHSGSLAVVECLVKNGANVNASDNDGISVLHYACYSGNLEVCQWLVDKRGGAVSNIHSKSNDGSSVLHDAAISGNLELCQWLVGEGLSYVGKDNNDRTVLHEACKYNNFSVANWLVPLKGIDVHSVDSMGNTLLIEAAKYGDSELCKWLIDVGLRDHVTDKRGRTLLHIAIEYGNLDVLQWLTGEDSNCNVKNQIRDLKGEDILLPILFTSANHDMKWMLKENSIVSKRIFPDGISRVDSIKHRNDDEDIILHLVEKGANVNAQNNDGQTIFHCAIENEKIHFVISLLKIKSGIADLMLRDKNGKTALDMATEPDKFNLLRALENLQIN